ncbi:zinc finger protein pita [Calliphora vicina]|uniref:zinc finger protein pita n=1 Tax=Calliphora vicina TaxID=7373 RepID=UPI00325B3BC2
MAALDYDALQAELKKRRICRFCLCQDICKLTNIYMRDTRIKSSAPLPIQIMAIASIEVFSNDGMPCYVCSECTAMFEYSYQFKQMCKKADNLLRQFPLTGKWPECLQKPILQQTQPPLATIVGPVKQNTKITQARIQHTSKSAGQNESLLLPKKILNSTVAAKVAASKAGKIPPDSLPNIESVTKINVAKVEKLEEGCNITFLQKIENNDELSLDDIHQLVAAEDVNETEFVNMDSLPVVVVDSGNKTTKPKLLNKSSVRILNKDAIRENEPRLSLPKIKKDVDGKMEIVAEILNVDDTYEDEPDPNNASVIETNVYPCPHCERTFPLLQLRELHLKNHSRDRKFQCDYCDKSFFSKYDLQRHSFIHNGEKPYKCSACDKAFSRSSLLSRHEKTHTDVPKFICIHCERSFISKDDMEKHAEHHNINRPFVCKICNKGFAFKQGLERHEVIHSRQQPYACQYCEQSFSTTTKLSRHLTAHAGLRPYPCKFCKKSYLLSHHLTRHLRCHRNIDDPVNSINFMCSSCNTSFATRDELIHHSTSHANESNLTCPLCKDVFGDMSTLTSHIQDHSEGEAYACEFCDLIFMTADKLQIHTDQEHALEMEVYHADDRAQADKRKEQSQKEASAISDEKLQSSVDEFLVDVLSDEVNESLESIKKKIKTETGKQSPKIINQIIIRSAANDKNDENQMEDKNSLLIPLKQRKLDAAAKKTITQTNTPQQTKQSPQLKRKTPNAKAATTTIRDAKQPTIQSLLKTPKSATATKTSPTKTMTPTNVLPKPKLIKLEKNASVDAASSSSSNAVGDSSADGIVKINISDKKVKVQRITVTKAQAAAMAKEGRIKIKDGKIILNK